jgi:hypothetical protein
LPVTPTWTEVSVHSRHVDSNAVPIVGDVILEPTFERAIDLSSDDFVYPVARTITLVDGEWTASLLATDDPDVTPTSFTWHLIESWPGGGEFYFQVPSASGPNAELGNLPIVPVVPVDEYDAFIAQVVDAAGGEGLFVSGTKASGLVPIVQGDNVAVVWDSVPEQFPITGIKADGRVPVVQSDNVEVQWVDLPEQGLLVTGTQSDGQVPTAQAGGGVAWEAIPEGFTVGGTPAGGRVPTLQADLATVLWADIPAGGGGPSDPYLIKPSSSGVDIGALINSALLVNGAVKVAPNPGSYWTVDTPIAIGSGESVDGFGQGTTNLRAGTGLTGADMFVMRTGTSAHFTISNLQIDGDLKANRGIYLYATGAPSAADASPDFFPIIEHVSIYDCTGDGIYAGGTYSGGLREARFRNLMIKHNGGYGLVVASSDTFISDVTCRSNGPGGFHLVSGASGSAKLFNCKAYYETIGINSAGVRAAIQGGEVQDCATGIIVGTDSRVNTTIDTSGSGSTPGLSVTGSGCTFDVHFVGRTPPSGSPGTPTYCVQFTSSTQVHAGVINTNRLGRTLDYQNTYLGTNRPSSASTLVISPASAA